MEILLTSIADMLHEILAEQMNMSSFVSNTMVLNVCS